MSDLVESAGQLVQNEDAKTPVDPIDEHVPDSESATSDIVAAFVEACDAVDDVFTRPIDPSPSSGCQKPKQAVQGSGAKFILEKVEDFFTESELENLENCCPDWKNLSLARRRVIICEIKEASAYFAYEDAKRRTLMAKSSLTFY
ncbi:Oidioi.mRNA.OKI2018_I69.chr1.g1465.t1.cds [Oikopleura dioica]|uniref:Oidioi.mRNA.OKI2018_I69.chr1.g1465.t1.cds n=1 Tax=Oikopleura dioica TaxID=34765 RepID=A0ABN7ST91_OIKDI|nr:Oidioi.mRNA.OKI2018_I69.chr1.g1465.t1.cds [Oikopleura dioica]